jgi:exodeoxyribonuclease VII large subunit
LAQRITHLQKRLRHPGQRLQDWHQRLDDLEARITGGLRQQFAGQSFNETALRLTAAMEQTLSKQQTRFAVSASRLKSPLKDIQMQQSELGSLQQRLETQRLIFLKNAAQEFETVTQRLEAVSPLKTLHRGYAMVLAKDDDGNRVILKDSTDMKEGDQVDTQLGLGSFRSTVTSTSTDSIVADIIPTAIAPIIVSSATNAPTTNAPTTNAPTTKEDKNGNPAS